MTVRTRFAPSPTGFLHVGSARTALYCWLYARKKGGQFILRIEDTDRERSTQEAIDAIIDAMSWLGLNCDEGPFFQMQRLNRYQEIAERLLDEGQAYRCYCSKERLEQIRIEQLAKKEKPRYDGHCRNLKNTNGSLHSSSKSFVIRFKNPSEGRVTIQDAVHGEVVIQNEELDDLILVRSDGIPTYNFGVVVDDIDMDITHVIRGDDHLANTPRQINIYHALGETVPIFAHIPMILGSDGKRLSKRHGAVSVQHYRREGILPDALLNYLIRLGWSHGDQEIFSREEMVDFFDIAHINKAAAIFNDEKLLWLNQHYIKESDPKKAVAELQLHLKDIGVFTDHGPQLKDVFIAQRERARTLKEMAEKSTYFYQDFESIDKDAKDKNLKGDAAPALKALREALSTLNTWKAENIHSCIAETADKLGLKLGKLAQPLRVAVTGNTISPPIDITCELIGRERVLNRLDRAMAQIWG